jgi:hypothetical protein
MMPDLQFLTKAATRQQRTTKHANKPNRRELVARRYNKAAYSHANSPEPRELALTVQCSYALTENQNGNDTGWNVTRDCREPVEQIVDAWRSPENSGSKRETQEEYGLAWKTWPGPNDSKCPSSKEYNHASRQRDGICSQYANANMLGNRGR